MKGYIPILIIIGSNTMYHIFQKNIPNTVHPIVSVIATYLVAFLTSVILLIFSPSIQVDMKNIDISIHWTSFVLGFTIIGVEIGYLLLYREGWNVSTSAVTNSIFVASLLFTIGIVGFHEHMTVQKGIGLIIGLCGIVLINL